MWCASYNARINPSSLIHTRSGYYSVYATYGYEFREGEQGDYSQYLYNSTSAECNGMYYGGQTVWFASPAINADGYICQVQKYNNGALGHDSIRRICFFTPNSFNSRKL